MLEASFSKPKIDSEKFIHLSNLLKRCHPPRIDEEYFKYCRAIFDQQWPENMAITDQWKPILQEAVQQFQLSYQQMLNIIGVLEDVRLAH
jgi:hypothetical protein